MTTSAFASRTTSPQEGVNAYEPGVCNIGPAEIARRRRAGHVGLIATVALLAALLLIDVHPLARLAVIVPAAISASGYLQARLKFCAGYGQLGVFNLDELGSTTAVTDADALARDRRRARQISLASFAIGTAVGVAAVLLPF
jgi:ferric-dicitrate binding protein FerR (iron transport regulator)